MGVSSVTVDSGSRYLDTNVAQRGPKAAGQYNLTVAVGDDAAVFVGDPAELGALVDRLAREVSTLPGGMPPHRNQFLDISTAHLPEHIGALAPERGLHGPLSFDGVTGYDLAPYGYLIWVPDDPVGYIAGYPDFPTELLAVQLHARSLGCNWIRFDCDSEPIAELATWKWKDD